MKIDYIAQGFSPSSSVTANLDVLWPDLVWAAITYGKNSSYPWTSSSGYARAERKYRTYLLYSCLREVSGRPVKTDGYTNMDATEKGAASYFLGMTLAKLAAERLLGVPWLWHISCGSQALSFLNGKSRPDMLGRDMLGNWIVVEAKGRSGDLDMNALISAKNQTQMVSTVNGGIPYCRMGVQAYFNPDLQIYLLDPPPFNNAVPIEFDTSRAFDEYYGVRHLLRQFGKTEKVLDVEYLVFDEAELGVRIGLPRALVENFDPPKVEHILKSLPQRYAERTSFTSKKHFEGTIQSAKNPSSILRSPATESLIQNLPKNSGIFADGFFIELDNRWDDENMALEPFNRK